VEKHTEVCYLVSVQLEQIVRFPTLSITFADLFSLANYPLRLLFAARHEFEYMFGIIDNGIVHQLHPCLDQDNRSDIHSVWVGIPEDEHIYWCCLVVFDTSITL